MLYGLCYSKWPENHVKELLQNKLSKTVNVDLILLFLKHGKDIVANIQISSEDQLGWNLESILSEVALCDGNNMEECVRCTLRAIKSAKNLDLQQSVFAAWMKSVLELQYTRITALNFIEGLDKANFSFKDINQNDKEKIQPFMITLLIQNQKDKEKAARTKTQEGAKNNFPDTPKEDGTDSKMPSREQKLALPLGIDVFLKKASENKWPLNSMVEFLEKSKLNQFDMEDYPVMFELTMESQPDKIIEIQDMFVKAGIQKVRNKSIWKILKEKNVNLNLSSFVRIMNMEDIDSRRAVSNFFLNENLIYCDADTVLQIAYYSLAFKNSLTSSQYMQLYNEMCTSDKSNQNKLIEIVKNATKDKTEFNKLIQTLEKANGKEVTQSDSEKVDSSPILTKAKYQTYFDKNPDCQVKVKMYWQEY